MKVVTRRAWLGMVALIAAMPWAVSGQQERESARFARELAKSIRQAFKEAA